MSGLSHLPLQQAIFTALNGDTALLALVNGVFDHVPQAVSAPYVRLHALRGHDISAVNNSTMSWRLSLIVVSRDAGQKKAVQAMERIYTLLHHANLSVSGQVLVALEWQESRVERLDDGVTLEGRMEFQAVVR